MAGTDAPRAIRIIVVLHYIAAFFWAVAGVIGIASGSVFLAVIGLAIAIAVAVLADRLLHGVPWARTVTMVLQSLAFVTALLQLSEGTVNLNLLIAPAIVLTLARNQECRAHFGLV